MAFPLDNGNRSSASVLITDQLRSDEAAIREISSLKGVDYPQVISTTRCNNLVGQFHRPARRQERYQLGVKRWRRAQEFLSLHARLEKFPVPSRFSEEERKRNLPLAERPVADLRYHTSIISGITAYWTVMRRRWQSTPGSSTAGQPARVWLDKATVSAVRAQACWAGSAASGGRKHRLVGVGHGTL